MALADQHFWGDSNSPQTREELGHGFDAADNFGSGYTIDNIASLGPGTDSNTLEFGQQRHTAAKSTVPLDHAQLSNNLPLMGLRRSYGDNHDEIPADEDLVFDESLTPSSTTMRSKRLSQSPETRKSPFYSPQSAISPTGSANAPWMTDGTIDNSPISVAADSPPAAPRNRRNRERNRVAAHKCRQKAKQSTSVLQERERQLSSQNRVLREHLGGLRDEILDLRTEILKHSRCDSDIIQNYIARSARDLH